MAKKKMSGTFGSKYGKRIREGVIKAKAKTRARYLCPSCSRLAVKRLSAGIWQCKKCKTKYASGAYEFNV